MDTRTRGLRMKITSNGTTATVPLAPVINAAPVADSKASASLAESGSADGALLQAARAQLQQMPEIDHAKVAQVRAALERGEISFDAGKLAGLIARYHGSHG